MRVEIVDSVLYTLAIICDVCEQAHTVRFNFKNYSTFVHADAPPGVNALLADMQQSASLADEPSPHFANTQQYDLPMFGGTGEETILTYFNLFITIIYWRCRQSSMGRSSRYGESVHRFLCVVLCLLRP